MGVYKLINRCPFCDETRAIHEAWIKGTLKAYYVGCNDKNCQGYHIDNAYSATTVRLDMLVARYGGLDKDLQTKSVLRHLSNGVWSKHKERADKRIECALCHRSIDKQHDYNCPVRIAKDILGEFDGQPSA